MVRTPQGGAGGEAEDEGDPMGEAITGKGRALGHLTWERCLRNSLGLFAVPS